MSKTNSACASHFFCTFSFRAFIKGPGVGISPDYYHYTGIAKLCRFLCQDDSKQKQPVVSL